MSAVARDPAEPAAAKKSRRLLLPILAAVLLSAGAAGAAVYFLTARHEPSGGEHEAAPASEHAEHGDAGHGKADANAKKGAATYLPLQPAFVVNLDDGGDAARFLQVEMEVLVRDAASADAVKLHTPRIRNALLMLLGQQKFRDLETRDGKEVLRAQVLAEVQGILSAETGKPAVEGVYFTSFVMQ